MQCVWSAEKGYTDCYPNDGWMDGCLVGGILVHEIFTVGTATGLEQEYKNKNLKETKSALNHTITHPNQKLGCGLKKRNILQFVLFSYCKVFFCLACWNQER